MAYMEGKMYSNSLYYIKAHNKYTVYQNRGKRSEKNKEFTWNLVFHVPKSP